MNWLDILKALALAPLALIALGVIFMLLLLISEI